MARKYHCPYCTFYDERDRLITHIGDEHEELIPKGSSPRRVVFNLINHKDHGTCVICKCDTKWNETAGKYDRLCGKKSCATEARRMYEENMIRVRHTTCMLNDPEHQEKMLASRKISKPYKFKDGGVVTCTGSYEYKLCEFEDKVLGICSKDIQMPGPVFEYEFEGQKHKWITDQLYIPWNLVIEVKDGGDNPNNRQMESYRKKQIAKETMITDLGTFNYIRLTNNDFSQLLSIFAELKAEMMDDSDENRRAIVRIHENAAVMGAIPSMDSENNTYVIQYGYKNNAFSDTEGFAIAPDLISDKILIVKDGKVSTESYDFLDDRVFSIYKYNGEKSLKDIITGEAVSDTYFYTALSGKPMLTKDQIDFDPLFETVMLEKHKELREAYNATVKYSFMRMNLDTVVPIMSKEINIIKENMIDGYSNIDVLEDIKGYFVINLENNQRSRSYKYISDIPEYMIECVANKNIMEEIFNV